MLNLHLEFSNSGILQSRNKQNIQFKKPLNRQGTDTCHHHTGEANHVKLYSQWKKLLPERNSN